MYFQDYLYSELCVLIPVLYLIGMGLKKSLLPDKWIPTALGAVAITLSAVWLLATNDITDLKETASACFTAATQGILAAGASVYANQLYLQAKKEE